MTDIMDALILVVEDDLAQAELLIYNLQANEYRVVHAQDGEEALLMADEHEPDLMILDRMLPKLSGIEVCRQLKKQNKTQQMPIIMLTARGEEADRIRGLDVGADDYVSKPYSVSELIARIRAILRRTHPTSVGEKLFYGDIDLDAGQHRVTRKGKTIRLGPTEFRLLSTLMENPGRVWSREHLLDKVWGRDKDVDMRTVDVHVGRLRKALGQFGDANIIRTVRGTGYSLDSDS